MAKLKHFAHPRGWVKGDPVAGFMERGTPVAGRMGPPEYLQADQAEGILTDLHFTNEPARDQWLKWWRKG